MLRKLFYPTLFIIILLSVFLEFKLNAAQLPNIDPHLSRAESLQLSLQGSMGKDHPFNSIERVFWYSKNNKTLIGVNLNGLTSGATYSLSLATRYQEYWDISYWFISPFSHFESDMANTAALVLGLGQWFSKDFQAEIGAGAGMAFPEIKYAPVIYGSAQLSNVQIIGGLFSESITAVYPGYIESTTSLGYPIDKGLSFNVSFSARQNGYKELNIFYVLGFGLTYEFKNVKQ